MCSFAAHAEYIAIESKEQLSNLIHSNKRVLIVFERPSCPWCRKQMPIVKKVAQQDNIIVADINTEKLPKLSDELLGNNGVPSFMTTTLSDNKVKGCLKIGLTQEADLIQFAKHVDE